MPIPPSVYKSACEYCSKAKTKCSGGNPCTTCSRKNVTCVYALKRKRGPKPGRIKVSSSPSKKAKPNFMSSYEKRVWSVFFSIFKNLRSTAKENKYSWEWFLVQLCKLDSYIKQAKSVKGRRLREVLANFYKSMDIDPEKLCQREKCCVVPPHLCGHCVSTAFMDDRSLIDSNGNITSSTNLYLDKHHLAIARWKASTFDRNYESNTQACLVYECSQNDFGVFVNNEFSSLFGHDNTSLNQLLKWSGGGFLPWGGDILAALLVNEHELLLYLKVLATKFQAITAQQSKTISDHKDEEDQYEETVLPFTDDFLCWVNPNPGTKASTIDLKSISTDLVAKHIKFTSTVRIKRKKSDMHKVFLRFELMCHYTESSSSEIQQLSNYPSRVDHTQPFVPTHQPTSKISSEMNRILWPPSVPLVEEPNLDLLLPDAKDLDFSLDWNTFEMEESESNFMKDEQWLQELVNWVEK